MSRFDSRFTASGGETIQKRMRLKWFNAGKGFGFVQDDDNGDAFLHVSVLQRANIQQLGEGAELLCDVGDGPKGQQVSRIIEVLSTGTPGANGYSAAGGGQERGDRGGDRFSNERHDRFGGDRFGGDRFGGDRFNSERGDRFGGDRFNSERGDRFGNSRSSQDRYGNNRGDRFGDDRFGGDRFGGDRFGDDRHGQRPERQRPEPTGPATDTTGTVKWYKPDKGFGFIVADDTGGDVFLHKSALRRAGLDDIAPGTKVNIRVQSVDKGREAVSLSVSE